MKSLILGVAKQWWISVHSILKSFYFILFSLFLTTLYFIFTCKAKITKIVKTRKKVAKLQFTKVIENYNLNYLYPYTWKISSFYFFLTYHNKVTDENYIIRTRIHNGFKTNKQTDNLNRTVLKRAAYSSLPQNSTFVKRGQIFNL